MVFGTHAGRDECQGGGLHLIYQQRKTKDADERWRSRLAVRAGTEGAAGAVPDGCTTAAPDITTPTTMAAMAAHITGDISVIDMSKSVEAESMNIHKCSMTPVHVMRTPVQNKEGTGY